MQAREQKTVTMMILKEHIRGLKKRIGRWALLCMSAFMVFGCMDTFDTALSREVVISKIVESNYIWTEIGTAATARSGAASAIYNDWLYIHGGKDDSGVLSDLWRINLDTGASEPLVSDMNRAYHSMVVVGDKLYVFGGIDASGAVIVKNNGLLKPYNITTGLWETEIGTNDTNGTFPPGRSGHVSFAHDGYLFIQGGEDGGSQVDSDLHRLEIQPETSTKKHVWTQPVAAEYRAGHGAAVINDVLYLVGGYDPSDDSFYKNMWTYDIYSGDTANVTVGGDLLERKNIALAALDGSLFTFGGETAAGLNAELLAGTTGGDWFSSDGDALKRSEYVLQKYGTRLVLFGGRNETAGIYYDDLWIISKE